MVTKVERVLKAINHQEVEPVPRGELLIAPEFIDKLCPAPELSSFERQKKALEILTMDLVTVSPANLKMVELSDGSYMDGWGRKVVSNQGYWITIEPPITDIQKWNSYYFPKVTDFVFDEIELWVKNTDFFVFALIDGIFQGTGSLLDFHQFLMTTVIKQQEITALAEAYGDFLYLLAEECVKRGVHGLIIGDDMASTQGPLCSPKAIEKIFFPVYRRFLGRMKKWQRPVIFHCDGNINFLLPYLVELGFDGVHSLEPAAGMDLAEIKEDYGDKLCLMGNIDPSLLESGEPFSVKQTVEETIKIGQPGGGFILSTASGSITGTMPLENVIAMYQA